jgi:hypothetical protein
MSELKQAVLRELDDLRDHADHLGQLAGEDPPVGELARTLVELGDVNRFLSELADRLKELMVPEPGGPDGRGPGPGPAAH